MTDALQYRKKPVVISALVWNGLNIREVQAFAGHGTAKKQEQRLRIKTLEGHIWADPGDYIIRGVNGEFYPCKPDIFAKTYDPADRRAEPVSVQEADPIAHMVSTSELLTRIEDDDYQCEDGPLNRSQSFKRLRARFPRALAADKQE